MYDQILRIHTILHKINLMHPEQPNSEALLQYNINNSTTLTSR